MCINIGDVHQFKDHYFIPLDLCNIFTVNYWNPPSASFMFHLNMQYLVPIRKTVYYRWNNVSFKLSEKFGVYGCLCTCFYSNLHCKENYAKFFHISLRIQWIKISNILFFLFISGKYILYIWIRLKQGISYNKQVK